MKLRLSFFLIILLTAAPLLLSGQAGNGESYYERLLSAQVEYQAALVSGDSSEIAEWSYIMGKRYWALDNQFYAKRYFLQALKIRETYGTPHDIGKIYTQLFYQTIPSGKFHQAEQYARSGFTYLMQSGIPLDLIAAYALLRDIHIQGLISVNKGSELRFTPSIDSALHYSEKVVEICKSISNTLIEGTNYTFIAEMYLQLGKTEECIQFSKKGLSLFQKQKKRPYMIIFGTSILMSKAYILSGKKEETKIWLNKINALADTTLGIPYKQIYIAHQLLADYYQKTDDWQKAFKHQQTAQIYKTSEYEAFRSAADEGLALLFDNEQKQSQLTAQKKELLLQRQNSEIKTWLSIVITIFFLGALVTGLFFYRLFRKYQTLSKENAGLLDEQNHRIKNNLQSVRDLLELQSMRVSDPKALQALEETIMRVEAVARVHHGLYEGGRMVEVEIEKYIPDLVNGILNAYARQDVKVNYQLDALWLQAEQAIPLGLILNELTTNACKYAFASIYKPKLEIGCRLKNGEVRFTFTDNGTGFDTVKNDGSGGSFGMRIITLLSGKLKGKGQFQSENGTRYSLTFCTEGKSQLNPIP